MKHTKGAMLFALCCLSSASSVSANEQLMEKSGCISCHRIDTKLIGPTFKDVAARYKLKPETIDYLLKKVREGGEGVWGDVPMAPSTIEKVSDENLKLIIEWVLSL
jgi:cytochrome c